MALHLTTREKTIAKLVDSYLYAAVGLEITYFGAVAINAMSGGKLHVDWAYAGYIALGSFAPPVLRVLDAKFPALTVLSNFILTFIGKKTSTTVLPAPVTTTLPVPTTPTV